jgi:hypothetical protein
VHGELATATNSEALAEGPGPAERAAGGG